ncbi:hypothetical protein [Aurantiacibacter sediminis]|uniref:Porin n=1 Tax=Aurantiacibacter sediminis TaxID=2793064 RepID=A0ABS0MZY5_9SPHN|nr:hypothetical protein [Aurantiacibacter sediminis]MBH5321268.1 hypothetical protein [Aurantiacibacter sediminis]
MKRQGTSLAGKLTLAASAAAFAIALPSSVLAIGLLNGESVAAPNASAHIAFTPAAADPAVAEMMARNSQGQARMMRFTPAGATGNNAERAVTVAVRVDQETAQALAASTSIAGARESDNMPSSLQVAPTRYNLGIARGFSNFAPATNSRSPELSSALSSANIPDISDFSPRTTSRDEPSRFAARVAMEESTNRRQDARASVGDQLLDLGGSYRLTNNLDITAGVRLEQDRDIMPLPDVEQQDSQAVYIGTQLRF